MSDSDEDRELVDKLHYGDRAAFEQVYRKYAAELFRYVAERVDGRANCERIVLETFVKIWTQRKALSLLRSDLYEALRFHIFKYIADSPDIEKYRDHFNKYFYDN